MCATIIAHGDPPPILDFRKHSLDVVTVFVEFRVVTDVVFTIGAGRDAGSDALSRSRFSEPICIIPAISQHRFCLGHFAHQNLRAFIIADLTCC